MTSPKITFFPSSGINPRNYSIYTGLLESFIQKSLEGLIQLNHTDEPDFWFSLHPAACEKKQKVIYYDIEGLYESSPKTSPDIVFTVEENAVEVFKNTFNCPVFHLPLGFDPEVYKTREMLQVTDIAFCGTLFDPRPEVLSWLAPLSEEFNIKVITPTSWASRLKDLEQIEVIQDREWVPITEVVEIFLSSKIILCINRASKNKRDESENKTIGRGFGESALRRCVFIDDSRDISSYFAPGEEIITFSLEEGGENLRDLLRYYLLNPKARNCVADRGFKRSYKEHTWDVRVSTILEILKTLQSL